MANDLAEYIHAPVSWKFVSPTLAFHVEKDGRLALMAAYGRVLSLFHDQFHDQLHGGGRGGGGGDLD